MNCSLLGMSVTFPFVVLMSMCLLLLSAGLPRKKARSMNRSWFSASHLPKCLEVHALYSMLAELAALPVGMVVHTSLLSWRL